MPDENEGTYKVIGSVRELNSDDIRNYWEQVADILKGAFQRSEADAHGLVANLQEKLSNAPEDTQLYFYHANPFQVAADLAESGPRIGLSAKQYYIKNVRKLPVDDRPDEAGLSRVLPDDLLPRRRPA
jgi:hypothetical protein